MSRALWAIPLHPPPRTSTIACPKPRCASGGWDVFFFLFFSYSAEGKKGCMIQWDVVLVTGGKKVQ